MYIQLHNIFIIFIEGLDAVVGDLSKAEDLRQALMERHRREVEEEAAGINALLFEHIDGDKNGTIELDGMLPLLLLIHDFSNNLPYPSSRIS